MTRGRRPLYIAKVPTLINLEGLCKAFLTLKKYEISEYFNNIVLDGVEKWILENRSDGDPIKKSFIASAEAQLPEIRKRRQARQLSKERRFRKIKKVSKQAQAEVIAEKRKAAVYSKIDEALGRVFPNPVGCRSRLWDLHGDNIEWWEEMARAATREAGLTVTVPECQRYVLKHLGEESIKA